MTRNATNASKRSSDGPTPPTYPWSDEELTTLALAADPHAPIDDEAVAWTGVFGVAGSLLPEWYMPRPLAVGRGRATQVVVASVIVAMLVIGGFGLCITSGFLSLA